MASVPMTNKKLSFLISLIYVGLGTLYLLISLKANFDSLLLYFFFLPVEIFPFLILYAERDPYGMLFICQLITIFILWPLFLLVLNLLRKKRPDAIEPKL